MVRERFNILTLPGLSLYLFVLLVRILIRLSCINNYRRRPETARFQLHVNSTTITS